MPSLEELTPNPSRVLLIHSHALDIRLPWANWHQPTGLLQIGAGLSLQGHEVRLIDCLGWNQPKRMTRRKVDEIKLDGYELDLWRYGATWGPILEQIQRFKQERWIPDQIYISCFQTSWWAAADEIAKRAKRWFPLAQVLLGGVYASLEQEHARLNTQADNVIVGSITDARDRVPDFALYPQGHCPHYAGIYLYRSKCVTDSEATTEVVTRPPGEIVQEIVAKAKLGVTKFAFFDEEVLLNKRNHFLEVLKAIAKNRRSKVGLIALGNISPKLIDDDIAYWMKKAGYIQINLKCDITHTPHGFSYDASYDDYQRCVNSLHDSGGFRPRTGEVTAMLQIGNPYEDIELVTERLIKLSSIVGSVNLVQYQYSKHIKSNMMYNELVRNVYPKIDPVLLNCKLYPLAQATGNSFADYIELTRLASLLNSKYRSRTFDFLGESFIASKIRESLRSEGWSPFPKFEAGPSAISPKSTED